MLNKLNSGLALLLSLLLLLHMFLMGGLMLGVLPFFPWFNTASMALLPLFILHALLSCLVLFKNRSTAKVKLYPTLNRSVYVQRISAILLVLLLPAHFFAFAQYRLAGILAFVSQLLLVVVTGIHMGVSMPKSLLGLGIIVKETTYKKAQIVSLILSAVASVYTIIGFCALATDSGIF